MKSFTKYSLDMTINFESLGSHCKLMKWTFRVKAKKIIFHIFFRFRIINYKFEWFLHIYIQNHYYFDNNRPWWLALLSSQEILLYKTITLEVSGIRLQKRDCNLMSFYLGFLLQTTTIPRTTREGRETSLFLCNTSSRSQTFRPFFIALHAR